MAQVDRQEGEQEDRKASPLVMSASRITYTCSICKDERPRDKLVVKRVQFKEMGAAGKVIRTRAVGWLCRDRPCLEEDPTYNRVEYHDAPGTIAKRSPTIETPDAEGE